MALTDVQHVEAVALINGILEHAPSLPPEIRRGAEGWLGENHPPPSAYMAAMGMLAGREEEAPSPKRGYLFREKGEDGRWSSWKVAELGIPSLLVKAQDRPDEYEVEQVVSIETLPAETQRWLGERG